MGSSPTSGTISNGNNGFRYYHSFFIFLSGLGPGQVPDRDTFPGVFRYVFQTDPFRNIQMAHEPVVDHDLLRSVFALPFDLVDFDPVDQPLQQRGCQDLD